MEDNLDFAGSGKNATTKVLRRIVIFYGGI
jgi:hypothetical protein